MTPCTSRRTCAERLTQAQQQHCAAGTSFPAHAAPCNECNALTTASSCCIASLPAGSCWLRCGRCTGGAAAAGVSGVRHGEDAAPGGQAGPGPAAEAFRPAGTAVDHCPVWSLSVQHRLAIGAKLELVHSRPPLPSPPRAPYWLKPKASLGQP